MHAQTDPDTGFLVVCSLLTIALGVGIMQTMIRVLNSPNAEHLTAKTAQGKAEVYT